jgi:hypothetical protein
MSGRRAERLDCRGSKGYDIGLERIEVHGKYGASVVVTLLPDRTAKAVEMRSPEEFGDSHGIMNLVEFVHIE